MPRCEDDLDEGRRLLRGAGVTAQRAHLRLVRQGTAASQAQRRQRELAWALFITEGLAGNLAHALAVNAYTMREDDLAALRKLEGHVQRGAEAIRRQMER